MERDQYVDFCAQQMDYVFGECLRDMGIAATDNGNRLSWREERMVAALLYAVANEMDRQRKQAASPAAQPAAADNDADLAMGELAAEQQEEEYLAIRAGGMGLPGANEPPRPFDPAVSHDLDSLTPEEAHELGIDDPQQDR